MTYVVGRSVQMAAEKLMERLQGTAASLMEVDPENLRFDRGSFYSPESPREAVSVAQAVEG